MCWWVMLIWWWWCGYYLLLLLLLASGCTNPIAMETAADCTYTMKPLCFWSTVAQSRKPEAQVVHCPLWCVICAATAISRIACLGRHASRSHTFPHGVDSQTSYPQSHFRYLMPPVLHLSPPPTLLHLSREEDDNDELFYATASTHYEDALMNQSCPHDNMTRNKMHLTTQCRFSYELKLSKL